MKACDYKDTLAFLGQSPFHARSAHLIL